MSSQPIRVYLAIGSTLHAVRLCSDVGAVARCIWFAHKTSKPDFNFISSHCTFRMATWTFVQIGVCSQQTLMMPRNQVPPFAFAQRKHVEIRVSVCRKRTQTKFQLTSFHTACQHRVLAIINRLWSHTKQHSRLQPKFNLIQLHQQCVFTLQPKPSRRTTENLTCATCLTCSDHLTFSSLENCNRRNTRNNHLSIMRQFHASIHSSSSAFTPCAWTVYNPSLSNKRRIYSDCV